MIKRYFLSAIVILLILLTGCSSAGGLPVPISNSKEKSDNDLDTKEDIPSSVVSETLDSLDNQIPEDDAPNATSDSSEITEDQDSNDLFTQIDTSRVIVDTKIAKTFIKGLIDEFNTDSTNFDNRWDISPSVLEYFSEIGGISEGIDEPVLKILEIGDNDKISYIYTVTSHRYIPPFAEDEAGSAFKEVFAGIMDISKEGVMKGSIFCTQESILLSDEGEELEKSDENSEDHIDTEDNSSPTPDNTDAPTQTIQPQIPSQPYQSSDAHQQPQQPTISQQQPSEPGDSQDIYPTQDYNNLIGPELEVPKQELPPLTEGLEWLNP